MKDKGNSQFNGGSNETKMFRPKTGCSSRLTLAVYPKKSINSLEPFDPLADQYMLILLTFLIQCQANR